MLQRRFNGPFNLNIYALRNPEPSREDGFNDQLVVVYDDESGATVTKVFNDFTIDPGACYAKNPLNQEGTACIVEGFHKSAYTFGFHHGRYRCLVPRRPIPVYRDRNRDGQPDRDGPLSTSSTVNLHHGNDVYRVGKTSAGCGVLRFRKAFGEFLALCDKQPGPPIFSLDVVLGVYSE